MQFEDPTNLAEGKEWIQHTLTLIPDHILTQFVTHQDFFGKLSGNRGIVNDVKTDVLFINLGK